jgi:peptidoglycan/xylan/chitin deacetylase (PgdA/CDA1 family)/glycosyltransferase involved in cell wall biosynthesis
MLRRLKTWLACLAYYSGALVLLRALHRRWYGGGIRIIFYHHVAAQPAAPDLLDHHPVTASDFERHLRHLKRFYHVISLSQAVEALRSNRSLPRNTVVITFDDGYRDNLTVALPLLRKFQFPAVLFPVTSAMDGEPLWFDQLRDWFERTQAAGCRCSAWDKTFDLSTKEERRRSYLQISGHLKRMSPCGRAAALRELRQSLEPEQPPAGERPCLNWEELREMVSSGLITLGGHTLSHPILLSLEERELRQEIQQSCELLSKRLNTAVPFFAYPNGDYNAEAQAVVRSLGLAACTTGSGFNPPGTDLTALKRMGAEGLSQFQFGLYLAGWEDVRNRVYFAVRAGVRRLKRFLLALLRLGGVLSFYRKLHAKELAVLLYHGVKPAGGAQLDNLHVPVEQFRRQMRWLKRHFTPVSLEQALAGLDGRSPLPRRPVLVTFDDAYQNNLQIAWGILQELEIPAALFVPTDFVEHGLSYWMEELEAGLLSTNVQSIRLPVPDGEVLWLRTSDQRRATFWSLSNTLKSLPERERQAVWADLKQQLQCEGNCLPAEKRLSWPELQQLARAGIAIGSHTSSHALLTRLPLAEVKGELQRSKQELESRLGVPVESFAYPNGDWNRDVRRLLKEAGYRAAFTVQPGFNNRATDLYLLRRIPINATDCFPEFVAAVCGFSHAGVKRETRILEIGNYPPPLCGWAMNTKFVAEQIRERGATCDVLNINPESRRMKGQTFVDVQNGRDYLGKLLRFAACGYRFHTHVNAESPKGFLLTLAAHLVGLLSGKPAVMTFHGGLPQTYFPRPDSRGLRCAFKLLFMTAGTITCDAPPIRQAIQSYGTNGTPITAIPCFSPQYLEFTARKLAPDIEKFLRNHDPAVFCYVSFRPEYALPELLQAMTLFAASQPRAGFIWLGFPAREAEAAREWLKQQPGGHPGNLLLLGNVDHDSFLSLLTRCKIYLRPPQCDGISASVLESLALGVPVVAAANERRPPGVVTYKFADPVDLCSKLTYVLQNYEAIQRQTRPVETDDYAGQMADWVLAAGVQPSVAVGRAANS